MLTLYVRRGAPATVICAAGMALLRLDSEGPAELSVLNGRSCMSSLVESRGAVGWTVGGD